MSKEIKGFFTIDSVVGDTDVVLFDADYEMKGWRFGGEYAAYIPSDPEFEMEECWGEWFHS